MKLMHSQISVNNKNTKVIGKSVESYFSSLTDKALEDKKIGREKKVNQFDSFGQWYEAD